MGSSSITDDRRVVIAQLARFIISGAFITVVALFVYAIAAVILHWHPQLGNFAAYAMALVTGYIVHSRWSFGGHGGERTRSTRLRFLAASLITYGLNSFWVWLVFSVLDLGRLAPMFPMALVTPVITFFINRHWVFR